MKIQELFSLEKKVAIVTGGATGIGKFISKGLAEAGANVVLASRNFDNCVATAKGIETLGVKALPVKCDLEKIEDLDNLVKATMDAFGKIDILINNAALTWGAPTLEYPVDKWEKVINVNLRGVFFLSN